MSSNSLSPAHLLGFTCYFAAVVLALFDLSLAVVPLLLFVGLCMVAPFLPCFFFFFQAEDGIRD